MTDSDLTDPDTAAASWQIGVQPDGFGTGRLQIPDETTETDDSTTEPSVQPTTDWHARLRWTFGTMVGSFVLALAVLVAFLWTGVRFLSWVALALFVVSLLARLVLPLAVYRDAAVSQWRDWQPNPVFYGVAMLLAPPGIDIAVLATYLLRRRYAEPLSRND